MNYIEIIGYLASAGVVLSFMMKDIKTIRYVNIVGCAFFVAYGYLINGIPIIATNAFIILVHIYYLFIKKQ